MAFLEHRKRKPDESKPQFMQKMVSTRGVNIGQAARLSSNPMHAITRRPELKAEQPENEETKVHKVSMYKGANPTLPLFALWTVPVPVVAIRTLATSKGAALAGPWVRTWAMRVCGSSPVVILPLCEHCLLISFF